MCFELAGRIVKALGAVTVVDETHGFRFFDNRDLLGFVDGTENPDGPLAVSATEIGDEDPDFAGGCYVHVQKYVHDMDVVGFAVGHRAGAGDRPHASSRTSRWTTTSSRPTPTSRSTSSRTRTATSCKIVRHNMPFGEIGKGEYGTYFIGYSRTAAVTERMLTNMFIGDPPGNTDRILDFSTAITGGKFFTPTVDFLNDPPPLPDSEPATRPASCHRRAHHGRLVGHRQPERNPSMNNLYRDLAPITEAAWDEIELEATRTFKRHIAGRRVVDVSEPGGAGDRGGQHAATSVDVAPARPTAWSRTCARASRWCGCGCRSP